MIICSAPLFFLPPPPLSISFAMSHIAALWWHSKKGQNNRILLSEVKIKYNWSSSSNHSRQSVFHYLFQTQFHIAVMRCIKYTHFWLNYNSLPAWVSWSEAIAASISSNSCFVDDFSLICENERILGSQVSAILCFMCLVISLLLITLHISSFS